MYIFISMIVLFVLFLCLYNVASTKCSFYNSITLIPWLKYRCWLNGSSKQIYDNKTKEYFNNFSIIDSNCNTCLGSTLTKSTYNLDTDAMKESLKQLLHDKLNLRLELISVQKKLHDVSKENIHLVTTLNDNKFTSPNERSILNQFSNASRFESNPRKLSFLTSTLVHPIEELDGHKKKKEETNSIYKKLDDVKNKIQCLKVHTKETKMFQEQLKNLSSTVAQLGELQDEVADLCNELCTTLEQLIV